MRAEGEERTEDETKRTERLEEESKGQDAQQELERTRGEKQR